MLTLLSHAGERMGSDPFVSFRVVRVQLRPPTRDDAAAILALLEARDIADIGRPDVSMADVLEPWQMPGIDPERDQVVAVAGDGALVGYALVDHRGGQCMVDPGQEGARLHAALREWAEERQRARGEPLTQALTASNAVAVADLRAAGYERVRVYQRMLAEDLTALPEPPPPVDGARLRDLDLEREATAAHELNEAAFAEIAGNVGDEFETWRAYVGSRTRPELRIVIEDEQGMAALGLAEVWDGGMGYVGVVAVDRRARGRGHGRRILLELLVRLRAAGCTRATLSVEGENLPALGLYRSAGMVPEFRQEKWQRNA